MTVCKWVIVALIQCDRGAWVRCVSVSVWQGVSGSVVQCVSMSVCQCVSASVSNAPRVGQVGSKYGAWV